MALSTLDSRLSTFNFQLSTFNFQLSTLDSRLSTFKTLFPPEVCRYLTPAVCIPFDNLVLI